MNTATTRAEAAPEAILPPQNVEREGVVSIHPNQIRIRGVQLTDDEFRVLCEIAVRLKVNDDEIEMRALEATVDRVPTKVPGSTNERHHGDSGKPEGYSQGGDEIGALEC